MLPVPMLGGTLHVTWCLQEPGKNPPEWPSQEPACRCNPAACAAGKAAQEMGAEPGSAGEAVPAGGMPDAMEEDVELAQRQDMDEGEEAEADEVDLVGKGVVSSGAGLSCPAGCCMTCSQGSPRCKCSRRAGEADAAEGRSCPCLVTPTVAVS